MSEINTTPLIDVMLVLLIMLIITIPVQMHGVTLEMPHDVPAGAPTTPDIVRLTADTGGNLRWNDDVIVSRADLAARLAAASGHVPQPEIHISAERGTRFAPVAMLLAESQKAGLLRIGIVAGRDMME